jgi:aminopeptidase N
MNKYDIRYLKLDLNVMPNSTFISGSCSYSLITTQVLDTFAIEFKDNMVLDSVVVNNVKRAFTRSANHIYVVFPSPVARGTTLRTDFYFNGNVLSGLSTGTMTSNNLVYSATLSESFQAREWYPAKQLLNYKIDSLDIWLTTSNPYIAGANGLLKQVIPLSGNRTQYRWSSGYPINYYLPCFAVGNYLDYRNYAKPAMLNGDSILVQHLVVNNPSFLSSIQLNLDRTPAFVEKMSELFSLYPFYKEKYGHLHADIGGGMEHQTMSTMSSFGLELIAHELGHQWFGDNVTCATWRDIWINEGFASYSAYLMREKFPSFYVNQAPAYMLSIHNNIMTQAGGSVYLPATEEYNEGRIFSSRLSYDKGSAVIHNLRFEMQSDTLFFNTLKNSNKLIKIHLLPLTILN